MATKPSFSSADYDDLSIVVRGVSDDTPPAGDIVDILVGLQQGKRIEFTRAQPAGEPEWTALFAREGSPPFDPTKELYAFGVETRRDPMKAITWADVLTAKQKT